MVARDAQPLHHLAPVSAAGGGRGGGCRPLCPAPAGLPSTLPSASSEGFFFSPLCSFSKSEALRPAWSSAFSTSQLFPPLPDFLADTALASELSYMSNLHFLPLLLTRPGPSWTCGDFSPALPGRWVLRPCCCPPHLLTLPGWHPPYTKPKIWLSYLCPLAGRGRHCSPAAVLLGLFQRSCILCRQRWQLVQPVGTGILGRPACR